MRGDWPSLTAMAVAFGRGLGTGGEAPDPHAAALLPAPLGAALRAAGNLGARSAIRAMTLGMVDHVCLRTAAIDAALREAIASGCTQLGILGAGLDARAWRIAETAETDVFEVDHPSTQPGKREAALGLRPCARSVVFVAVDFERERVGARLQDEGHDASRPTAWIWEGVTPYLHPAAIEQTLADVEARSAPGSVLMMTYAIAELVPLPVPGIGALTKLAFRGLGEALFGAMAPARAEALLADHGFALVSDTDARDWAALGPGSPTLARPFRGERLAVARRVTAS